MLGWFFHEWERRLASVTKDRVVRPFDWGTDWLQSNGHAQLAADQQVCTWVDEVMRDTAGFFSPSPTRAYDFEAATPELRRGGEAGTLRFTSALATPDPENNTVVARWFPARNEAPVDTKPASRGRAV